MEIHDRADFEFFDTAKVSKLGIYFDLDIYTNEWAELEAKIRLADKLYQPELVLLLLFHCSEEIVLCEHDDYGRPITYQNELGETEYFREKVVEVVRPDVLEDAIYGEHEAFSNAIYSYLTYLEKLENKQEAA